MEEILREPVELIDDDLDEVAGGLASSAAASSGLTAAGATSTVGGISQAFLNGVQLGRGNGLTNAAAIGF